MLKTIGNLSTRIGDQTIDNGNLIIGTAGKGIDFSADPSAPGMTSELLDDYEEGTWTPSYGGTTGDPTVTFSTQFGYYTKIGNFVYCNLRINLSAASGGSGSLRLTGLPFTPQNLTGSLHTSGFAYRANWTVAGPDGTYIINNQAFAYLFAGAVTGVTSLTPTNLSNTAQLILSFTYTTA